MARAVTSVSLRVRQNTRRGRSAERAITPSAWPRESTGSTAYVMPGRSAFPATTRTSCPSNTSALILSITGGDAVAVNALTMRTPSLRTRSPTRR